MVNYTTSKEISFNTLMLNSFALCAECINIEVWEDLPCSKKLNRLVNYKNALLKLEFADDYEQNQRNEMVKDLSALIEKLETLKLIAIS